VSRVRERLCPDCARRAKGTPVDGGRTWEYDLDDSAQVTAWKLAHGQGCEHPRPKAKSLRRLCPYRVAEWKVARGDERWELLKGMRQPVTGWVIDLADERVKAFLTEEGEAARVLLSACP
jgi:hypothetical protein